MPPIGVYAENMFFIVRCKMDSPTDWTAASLRHGMFGVPSSSEVVRKYSENGAGHQIGRARER